MEDKYENGRTKENAQESRRRWYHKNAEREISLQVQRNAVKRQERQQWLREYRAKLKCARCSENDPVCLEFHHRNPDEKDLAISRVINCGWSMKRILNEIAKCDVLCANCHRKHHHKQAGQRVN